jgi:prepilin-type N-terminal cleavage/methylation domain-containing protein
MRFASIGLLAVSSLNACPRGRKVELQDRGRQRHGSRGFTLLEALTAIVILALSLSTLMAAYRTGLQGVAAIDDHLRARLLAQSVLAEWTQYRILQPGRFQGRLDRFTWTVAIMPFDEAGGTYRQQSDQWKLHKLTVGVSWPHGRQIELNTLRLLHAQ